MLRGTLIFLIRIYRWVISPLKQSLFGPMGRCRFVPSCSAYAIDALRFHGVWHGSILALKRLIRCHPWGGCGWDPVPPPDTISGRKKKCCQLNKFVTPGDGLQRAGLEDNSAPEAVRIM